MKKRLIGGWCWQREWLSAHPGASQYDSGFAGAADLHFLAIRQTPRFVGDPGRRPGSDHRSCFLLAGNLADVGQLDPSRAKPLFRSLAHREPGDRNLGPKSRPGRPVGKLLGWSAL